MLHKSFIFFILLILSSCSEKQFFIENYRNYPVKFAKTQFVYPNNEFEILLPSNWKSKIETFEDIDEIILGIDAISIPDNKNYFDVISIQKMKPISLKKDLESEYETFIKKIEEQSSLKIIDSGETDLLESEAYYIHSKSTKSDFGKIEMITLITKSKNDDNFYYLSASSQSNQELELKMSIMINCIASFKQP